MGSPPTPMRDLKMFRSDRILFRASRSCMITVSRRVRETFSMAVTPAARYSALDWTKLTPAMEAMVIRTMVVEARNSLY